MVRRAHPINSVCDLWRRIYLLTGGLHRRAYGLEACGMDRGGDLASCQDVFLQPFPCTYTDPA